MEIYKYEPNASTNTGLTKASQTWHTNQTNRQLDDSHGLQTSKVDTDHHH
jgi:hypothetical protein